MLSVPQGCGSEAENSPGHRVKQASVRYPPRPRAGTFFSEAAVVADIGTVHLQGKNVAGASVGHTSAVTCPRSSRCHTCSANDDHLRGRKTEVRDLQDPKHSHRDLPRYRTALEERVLSSHRKSWRGKRPRTLASDICNSRI